MWGHQRVFISTFLSLKNGLKHLKDHKLIRNNLIHELSVEDIDILLSDLKVFFRKLNKLKQTIAVKKK